MNPRELNTSVLVPNLMFLLLVAFGVLSYQTPLVSVRPRSAPTENATVAARLWQDPLSIKADGAGRQPLNAHLGKRDNRVLVLPILLNGQRYPEARETRLRTRYAILAALNRAQFVPAAADTINFAAETPSYPRAVAFEVFESRNLVSDRVAKTSPPASPPADGDAEIKMYDSFDRVFLLWLDETMLVSGQNTARDQSGTLIGRLDDLLRTLLLGGLENSTVRIIGPSSSDVLMSLADGDVHKTDAKVTNAAILSPRATIANELIQMSVLRDAWQPNFPRHRPGEWPIYRTITTDDRLMETLLAELERRKARPSSEKHIVLIGEWDSLYSRGIGRSLAAKLNAGGASPDSEIFHRRATWAANPYYFHEFSYLRGIDGQLPDNPKPGTAETDAAKTADAKASATPRATGEAQTDYLRRLQDRLLALQQKIHATANETGKKAEIGAIGVVGSDVYDKLLVLRALRDHFPRAVFFTTDLDASYLDANEREWTRNLVIVSPYGLTAADGLQGKTPPFRDSYQTALYLTCLQALNVYAAGNRPFSVVDRPGLPNASDPQTHAPRVFEIGRSRIFDLSAWRDPANKELKIAPLPEAAIHPPPGYGSSFRWLSGSVAGAVISLMLAALMWALCVRGGILIRKETNSVNVRDSTRSYIATLGFGILWCAATIGAIATISYTRERWPVMMEPLAGLCIVGSLVYAWTFSVLLQHFVYETPLHQVIEGTRNRIALALFTLFSGCGLFLLVRTINIVCTRHSEEIFAWCEGVSVWPTDVMRAAAIVFGLHFILKAQHDLLQLKAQISRTHSLSAPSTSQCRPKPLGSDWKNIKLWPELFWFKVRNDPSYPSATGPSDDAKSDYVEKEKSLWEEYCRITTLPVRYPRIVAFSAVYLCFFLSLAGQLEMPYVPARGAWSRALDAGVLASAVLVYTYLLFYVFDATLLAAEFTKRLSWFIGTPSALEETQAVHVINDLVRIVGKLIYLPFSLLFMLIVSRNPLFDRWDWPPLLLGIFASGLLLIIVASLKLQWAASAAKTRALEDIDRRIAEVGKRRAESVLSRSETRHGSSPSSNANPLAAFDPAVLKTLSNRTIVDIVKLTAARQAMTIIASATSSAHKVVFRSESQPDGTPKPVEDYVRENSLLAPAECFDKREAELREQRRQIEAFNDVAFQHWHQNPIFRAILIPLGGFGSLQILEKVVSTLPQ